MDLNKKTPSVSDTHFVNHQLVSPTSIPSKSSRDIFAEGVATSERIPTSTRIIRKVNEKRMDRLGRSGTFKQRSYERRHKDLQEADLEWNNNPPMVYEDKISTPESIHCSKHSSVSSSGWSSHSTLEIAQNHHYNDINFIKNQPPGVQLRLALENSSTSNLTTAEPILVALTISSRSSKSSKSTNSSALSSSSRNNNLPLPPTQCNNLQKRQ
ncbi:unnamed protein product [Mucor hiemalis]